MTLSVCLIVKDEEEAIERVLNCVTGFADEIVVVDTGSADKTVELAKKFTDKIYFFEWRDDFSAARNFAFEQAECDYVMWLDADDVISVENCTKIRALLNGATFDMAFLPYASVNENGERVLEYYRERIFKRSKNYTFSGAVHEAVTPQGNIVYSDATIYHKKVKAGDPLRNLRIYQGMLSRGTRLDERSKFYYGRELYYNGMYLESAAVLEDFLDGDGWTENKIEACLNLCSVYEIAGNREKAVGYLFKSFRYAPPRSMACCMLGEYFSSQNDSDSAIYWYKCALNCDNGEKNGAFVNLDYVAFIPLMRLCVLYDGLGDFETADYYNERAGKIKPRDASYLENKKYFERKFNKEVKNL